jgi:hypothetical protein
VGVVGTADDNSAGNFFNDSSADATLFVGNNSTANSTAPVLIAKGDNVGGLCTIDVSGDLTCNGTVEGNVGDSVAGSFISDSASDTSTAALFVRNEGTTTSDLVLEAVGLSEGLLNDQCDIDVSGDLFCTGTVSGVVSADGGARKVALYAMQSPENWFEDFGSGALSNGAATIRLDPIFAQAANTETEYHVFLTPNGDSKGLYVSQKTATSFEVREQGGGTSSIAFDYRIVAKRVGYEKVRLADLTEQFKKQEAQRKKMLRARSASAPKASPKLPTLPGLPVRAALQPVAAQPR